jgi:GTP:adenosylcobinamide-phosphate guanylyltransferase
MGIQAVLLAGDRGASRAVKGRSKAFVEVAGRPMLVHVLEALLHTPEVTEVFIVADAVRLEKTLARFGCLEQAARRACPIHVIPQRQSLVENVWHAFLRALPPGEDPDHPILVVPSDIPLVVPEEISSFVRSATAADADHVVGLTPDWVLDDYAPRDGSPGMRMACFNLAEGRLRQNNLNWVRPLRMGHRQYIQDMYENRYQKEAGSMLRLGARIIRKEWRNLWVLFPYLFMHVAGVLDRRGHRRASDRVRALVSLRTVERGLGAMLQTRLATVETHLGGAALDVDNDEDLEVAEKMLERWKAVQIRTARLAADELYS